MHAPNLYPPALSESTELGGWEVSTFHSLPFGDREKIGLCAKGTLSDRDAPLPLSPEINACIAQTDLVVGEVIATIVDGLCETLALEFRLMGIHDVDTCDDLALKIFRSMGESIAADLLRMRFGIQLSLQEALVNSARHGNRCNPMLPVRYERTIAPGGDFQFAVHDCGNGFDPKKVPDPTDDEFLEKASGRGLYLIRTFMDSVRHSHGGRRLEFSVGIRRHLQRFIGIFFEDQEKRTVFLRH